ncbi:MAG TPA: adenylate/guanylate cyclase domain-containing protein, partial [Actinomycetota bacterium]|nr:adenylate/guanylate cyclase domain-containing protein [Actinomycetota bacterium]
ERRGLARELIEAWAQRDLVEPPMTPERLAHTRRKRVLQVLLLVWLLANGILVLIWAMEPGEKSLAGFWPVRVAVVTGLPVIIVGLYVFAKRPIKEAPTRWGTGRGVATVLFTDIVGSTERAQGLGDRQWRDLLDRHDAAAGSVVRRHGGRLIKTTGDGVLATFDAPGQAIQAARDLREEARSIGIDLRAGVHTGEVERRGADVGGIGVHIAARVMGAAEPGQILVSRTVRDLVVGSDLSLVPRGTATLRGIEGEWELFLVADARG